MTLTGTIITDEFEGYRPYLFSIAYRMMGSASEAEDIVQDTYLRYLQAPSSEIRSPKSYLATLVTRLCIDHLRSARIQREEYIGPWLPEPLLTSDQEAMPFETAAQHESISLAFLVLLETLSPPERAVARNAPASSQPLSPGLPGGRCRGIERDSGARCGQLWRWRRESPGCSPSCCWDRRGDAPLAVPHAQSARRSLDHL